MNFSGSEKKKKIIYNNEISLENEEKEDIKKLFNVCLIPPNANTKYTEIKQDYHQIYINK